MFSEPVWGDLTFVTWWAIRRRRSDSGHQGMTTGSCCDTVGWIHAFMLPPPNFDPIIQMSQHGIGTMRRFSSDQAMTFFYMVLFCWAHMSLGFMFFCCCSPSTSRFNVLCWLRDNLLHTLVVVSAYLRSYYLPISLKQSSFFPVTSGKSKGFFLQATRYFLFIRQLSVKLIWLYI